MQRSRSPLQNSRLAYVTFGVLGLNLIFAEGDGVVAFDPATDHKCVWNCDPPAGRRTITIWIEQAPKIILGPPQIVWRRPSSEGSSQTNFTGFNNPVGQRELENLSQTSWQFYGKAQAALKRGDCNIAAEYLSAAMKRNPPRNEIGDIQSAIRDANDCIKKFRKSDDTLALIVDIEGEDKVLDMLFDPSRKDLETARQQVLPILLKRADAKARFWKLDDSIKAQESARTLGQKIDQVKLDATKRERDEARQEAQSTEDKMREKVSEIKQTYHLE